MARHGGYGGGMAPNMANLMKQAQKMQQQMAEKAQELEGREYTATAGGGAVAVAMTGKRELTKVTIDPEAVDPDDVEMLQDMIVVAINDVLKQVEEATGKMMGQLTGGMNGLF